MNAEMTPEPTALQRALLLAVQAAAALAGLYFGYDIGSRISGPGLGTIMALCSAVFAWLMASGIVEQLQRWRAGRRTPR